VAIVQLYLNADRPAGIVCGYRNDKNRAVNVERLFPDRPTEVDSVQAKLMLEQNGHIVSKTPFEKDVDGKVVGKKDATDLDLLMARSKQELLDMRASVGLRDAQGNFLIPAKSNKVQLAKAILSAHIARGTKPEPVADSVVTEPVLTETPPPDLKDLPVTELAKMADVIYKPGMSKKDLIDKIVNSGARADSLHPQSDTVVENQ